MRPKDLPDTSRSRHSESERPIADAPPDALVALGKALGDEIRLRALRSLASGPRTLNDLAVDLGVPRTTLAHHMGVLTDAGLITHTVERGRWGRLALCSDVLDDLDPLVRTYIDGAARNR